MYNCNAEGAYYLLHLGEVHLDMTKLPILGRDGIFLILLLQLHVEARYTWIRQRYLLRWFELLILLLPVSINYGFTPSALTQGTFPTSISLATYYDIFWMTQSALAPPVLIDLFADEVFANLVHVLYKYLVTSENISFRVDKSAQAFGERIITLIESNFVVYCSVDVRSYWSAWLAFQMSALSSNQPATNPPTLSIVAAFNEQAPFFSVVHVAHCIFIYSSMLVISFPELCLDLSLQLLVPKRGGDVVT